MEHDDYLFIECGTLCVKCILMAVYFLPFIFHYHSLKHLVYWNKPSARVQQSHEAWTLVLNWSIQNGLESHCLRLCMSVWGQGRSHHVKPSPCLNYAHEFWDSNACCLFIVRCFPNCEQLISISFLINVTSPLFNHTAYRHVLESQLEKKNREGKDHFFHPTLLKRSPCVRIVR